MQTVKPCVSQGGYSTNRERRLKCMYTTQLTKKRKTWSDGQLKVFFSGGSYQCSLLDCGRLRETILVSRQLEILEVQQLKKSEEIELDFEGYLVTVCAGTSEHDEAKVGPPLKLPKFVPPSRYVPPVRQVDHFVNESKGNVSVNSRQESVSGPYKVSSDELDEIWDRDQPPKSRRSTTEQTEPPAFLAYSTDHTQQRPSVQRHDTHPNYHSASRPSIEATLRQTGANPGADASQPALTRYFAPALPVVENISKQVPHTVPVPAPHSPTRGLSRPEPHKSTGYGRFAGHEQSGSDFKNSVSIAGPVTSAPQNRLDPHSGNNADLHIAFQQRETTSVRAESSFIPYRAHPSIAQTGLISTYSIETSSMGGAPQTGSTVTNCSAPVVRASESHSSATSKTAVPVKTPYSTIIGSSVWDSD